MKKYIIFYSHNFWWLGHNKRLSLIIRELLSNFWDEYSCIFINSWEKQDFLFNGIKWLKIINLPVLDIKDWKIIKNNLNNKKLILRKQLLNKILNIWNSESLIIEHYPFWRNFLNDEIKFVINNFRKNNKYWSVFSSFRDIVDLGSLNKENINLFDRFLIHGDETITNYDNVFDDIIRNKFIYTWYVSEEINFKKIKKDKIIYINIWWWQDWMDYLKDFLNKFNLVSSKNDFKLIISLWNSYLTENIEILKKIYIWKNIEFHKYIDNSLEMKLKSQFSVSMGWYNNMVESLKYNIKTIIYPRQTDNEQKDRLLMFQKISPNFYNWFDFKEDDLNFLLSNNNLEISDNNINFNWAYFTSNFIVNFKKYKYIKIRVSNLCNAKCWMCWVIKRKQSENKLDNLKKTILDFYKLWWEVVNLTWWEPTIYKWFWDLLIYSKYLWLINSVSTNWSTLWEQFFKKLLFKNNLLINYMDISIDWLYEEHDKRRKYKWLFNIISQNIKKLIDLWIFMHINITIRKDNIKEIINIFDFFKNIWVNSISFWIIESNPLNDTSKLIPIKEDIKEFYMIDKYNIINNPWKLKIIFSPDFNWKNIDNFIKSIQSKNAFPKKDWKKCNFIKNKKEIRINENWNISPCCEIDDFDEWIWNINQNNLLKIICSKNYENFLNRKLPNISRACLNCKIEG